jgi:hypothetical protein
VGVYTVAKENHPTLNTNTLDFLKKNVLGVTDVTRSNKLSDILDRFSKGPTDEVFVIQNAKKKNAQAAVVSLEYFEQLLTIKEALDEALDKVALEEAQNRAEKSANFALHDVFDEEDIDLNQLMKQLEEE